MYDAFDLADYLPVSFKTPAEQEYIAFLWAVFEENYDSDKFQFAFLAYHMLMMSFVYFNIWQIRQTWPNDFEKGLIGFTRNGNTLIKATSPFSFSIENERTILRLFRLIGCDSSKIGTYSKLVDDRNQTAHANGNIFFASQYEIDQEIQMVLRAVEEIQTHSQPIIRHCYERFLLDSHDPEEREFINPEDQIREVLVHANYMSSKDIEFCANFDISTLDHDRIDAIEALHNTLSEVYGPA